MKKIILFASLLFSITALGQQPVITFDKTTHDFGKINEADGRVTTVFEFKNEGMIPLILSNVRASCGCTTPKWTREPIAPGATGQITVTYNPNGRPGRFQKSITVTSNTETPTTRLYIKGEVIPKPVDPAQKYPVRMGELNLKKNSWNYGILAKKPGSRISYIEYANTTDHTIKVALETLPGDNYLKPMATRKEIKPGETGNIQLAFNTNDCPIWGPVETKLYVIVNGERKITDEYAITIKADVREDFSKLTVEQQQQAPIIDMANMINVGTIKAGKKYTAKLSMSNAGINPLLIRRIVNNDDALTVHEPKVAIKSGKKAEATILINTAGLAPGNYSRVISVISNDPKKSVIRVTINWVVE